MHIKAVTLEWLQQCHRHQSYVDESPYIVAGSGQFQLPRASSGPEPSTNTIVRASSMTAAGAAALHEAAELAGAGGSRQSAEPEQQPAAQGRQQQGIAAAAAAPPASALAAVAAGLAAGDIEATVLPEHTSEDYYLFLDHVTLHLVGCSEEESRSCLQAVREGAATREPELCDRVTHIVVGGCTTTLPDL